MKIEFFNNNVTALFSEKVNGSMRLHGNESYDRPALANRKKYLSDNGVSPEHTIRAELIHGSHSEIVSDPKRRDVAMPRCDALMTDQKGVYLAITAADCFPVYFHDPINGVVGLIHAGWKGILKGVIESTLEKAEAALALDFKQTKVFIGPGIRSCHFEVGKDVADQFRGFVIERQVQVPIIPAVGDRGNNDTHETVKKYFVDLERCIKERLVQCGIAADNIAAAGRCSFCYKAITELKPLPEKSAIEYQYFSFRREKSDPLQTAIAVIGMK